MNAWLDRKHSTNTARNERIKIIRENLDFPRLSFEELNQGEKFIIVPIKKGFIANAHKADNPINNLLLILDKQGNIRKGNLVQYIPENRQAMNSVPAYTFYGMFNDHKVGADGRFVFLSIFDKFLYETKYENGSQETFSEIRPKSEPANTASRENQTCTDWYLITTYYYADGTTVTYESFLYTTCSGCQPGELCSEIDGTGGGDGNSVDYEYNVSKSVYWTVHSFRAAGEIKSIERLRGKRVATASQGGYFTGSQPSK